MFTGIIEEKGTIKELRKASDQAIQLVIGASKVIEDMKVGDSISVNGICLTVTNFTPADFQVDVMPETIKSTSLASLKTESMVNLERSMPANGRFGGHFVSGHVDGTGEIVSKESLENAIYYEVKIDEELSPYLLEKGSIAVDGISLTIFDVNENIFTISLIPHTVSETILGEKGKGEIVNIECDMLAKHVQNILNHQLTHHKDGINQAFL
ncbi:riboflavin synthase [Virgibacillus oceani]|uniref:Riboflavin synthase n=1 Tax=Virgibacillus oceani TaxID=1479511 RepID=A0A917HCK8_9BACI|nr:riboflavin synthase [Virgibacillus oceani]GGG74552.1 riboflavin synthase subunit alpha [Virgibacillus oceani]